jgi:hypothetical protein
MPKVEVTIGEDGSVRPDFIGFAGDACLKADETLRARLAHFGITLQEVKMTPKPELLAAQGDRQAVLRPQQMHELQRGGE